MPLLKKIACFLARYSEGLRLAVQHGPRSGRVCEYACDNEPQGSGVLGRLIDQAFLRSRAWDGLRQRVGTTKALVAEVVGGRRASRQSTMILDIAAGTARYLREFVREQGGDDLIIAAHDRDPREVVLGRELVAAEGLSNFTFAVGDATDHSSYLTSRDPDIILAVGLFARLQRDAAVRTVMQLSFAHLNPGGCFICTTLTGPRVRDPDPFGTRPAVRPPETIAAWLRETGFVRIDQRFSEPQGFVMIGWKPGQGMFRKVFVTGGNGFIGRALMRLYRERGVEVCGMDFRADRDWNVVGGDLIEPASWQSAANGCDLMIHTAALVSNTSSMLDSWRANVLGTRRALDVAVAAGVRRFVHISSVGVFGFEHETDVDEKVPLRPIGHPYVDSKIASEHTVLMAHASGEIECTIIRPGDVYGPASRAWVVLPLEMLKAGRFLLPAHGQGIFSPVYIDDLVDGIARAAESPAGAGQVFNLTGTEKLTCAEYFGYLASMLGKSRFPSVSTGLANVVTDVVGGATRMLGRPSELGRNTMWMLARRAGYSIEKARRLIGYEPRVTLADGMARVEQWCREHRLI